MVSCSRMMRVGAVFLQHVHRRLQYFGAALGIGADQELAAHVEGHADGKHHRVLVRGRSALFARPHQVFDDPDNLDGLIAPAVERLAQCAAIRIERVGHAAGDDRRRDGAGGVGLVQRFPFEEFVAVELASGHQVQAEGIEELIVRHVDRGVQILMGLLLVQADAAVPRTVVECHLVGHGSGLHAGEGAQCRQVGLGECFGIVVAADAGQLDAHDFLLGQTADAVHAFQPPVDQEQGVADDRAAQRDLDDDQRGGGLVPAQRGEDGADVHECAPGSCRSGRGARERELPRVQRPERRLDHWDLSWMAGVTWQARQAGSRPASTLARIARPKVVSSITGSRCASSA